MEPQIIDFNRCIHQQDCEIVHDEKIACYTYAHRLIHSCPYLIEGVLCSLLESGHLKGRINGIEYNIEAPSITIFPSGQIIEEIYHSKDCITHQIFISSEYVKELNFNDWEQRRILIMQNPSYRMCEKQFEQMKFLYGMIKDVIASNFQYKNRFLYGIMIASAYHPAMRNFLENLSKNEMKITTNRFIQLVGNNFLQHTTAKYYAKELNLSVSQLERIIKNDTGKTILQWIHQIKNHVFRPLYK